MPDQEQLDEFLGDLEAIGGHAGNGKLRELLGCNEAAYEEVKAELVAKRIVVPGDGSDAALRSGGGIASPAMALHGAP